MKWSQNFLSIGVLCIVAGLILLVVGSGGVGDSTFFIFPFFFFSTAEPLGIFMFLGLTLIIVILMLRTVSNTTFHHASSERFFVQTKCVYCSSPVPRGASYCPTCGNAMIDDNIANE